MYGNVLTTVEKVGTETLRTTTTEYDEGERVRRTWVTASEGAPLPVVETAYDEYGNPHETRAIIDGVTTASVKRTMNALGQTTKYQDSDNVTSTTTYDVMGRVAQSFDGKGTQTLTYADPRGLPTRLEDSQAGMWTASYDAARAPTVDWPNGVREEWTLDEADAASGLSYARTSGCSGSACVLLSFSAYRSVHGELLQQTSTLSSQTYGYDGLSRLTSVADTFAGACTTRRYTYDGGSAGNGNRTKLEVFAPEGSGCQTATAASTMTSTYDTADRLTTAGTSYDTLGRTTVVPARDTLDGAAVTMTYHVNDLVASISQNGASRTYTLDVDQERVRSSIAGGVIRTNHYSDDGDSPSWTQESPTSWTRNVIGIRGDMAAIADAGGVTKYQYSSMHGDVVATATPEEVALSETFESTEFGAPRGALGRRYGWLGAKRRAADTPGGLSIMGVRLYNPATARFLQVDPVDGGGPNPYDYAGQNPITNFDLDGRTCLSVTRCGGLGGMWLGSGSGVVIGSLRVVGRAVAVTLASGVVIYVSAHAMDPYELMDRLRAMAKRKKVPRRVRENEHRTTKNGRGRREAHEDAQGYGPRVPLKNPNKRPPRPKKDNNGDDKVG